MILENAVLQAMGNAFIAQVDAASPTAGYMKVMDDSGTPVELVTLTFSDPCGTATNGVVTFAAIADQNAIASGTAAFCEIYDGADTYLGKFSLGTVGSGEDVEMNSTSIVSGAPVSVASLTFTTAGLGSQA